MRRSRHGQTYRVFCSKPGRLGSGLQALMDEGGWNDRGDSCRRLSLTGAASALMAAAPKQGARTILPTVLGMSIGGAYRRQP